MLPLPGRRDGARQESQKKPRDKGSRWAASPGGKHPPLRGRCSVRPWGHKTQHRAKAPHHPSRGTPWHNSGTPGAGRAWDRGGQFTGRAKTCRHRVSTLSSCLVPPWFVLAGAAGKGLVWGFLGTSPGRGLCCITNLLLTTAGEGSPLTVAVSCTPMNVPAPSSLSRCPNPRLELHHPSAPSAMCWEHNHPPGPGFAASPPLPTRGSLVKSDNRRGGMRGG